MKIQDVAQKAELLQYVNQQNKVNTTSVRVIKKIEEVALSAPDTRTDKVAALKKEVESGTYQVNSYALAGKIIERFYR